MAKTSIEWTDENWNFLRGCSRKSPGCANCYAESIARRFCGPGLQYEGLIGKHGQYNGKIMQVPEKLQEPLSWKKPRKVFVCSTSDLFHENVPFDYIDRAFAVMSTCPQHTFQILTKRPERMREYMLNHEVCVRDCVKYDLEVAEAMQRPLPNVWLGVSIEDQATADERIPLLLQTPAAVRWVSAEPLLGPVNMTWVDRSDGMMVEKFPCIDWVVAGGESGAKARPTHPEWVRSIRDQCVAAGVPFLFKQWGKFAPNWLNDDNGNKIQETEWMDPVGKKKSGRMLDGVVWDQYPGAD